MEKKVAGATGLPESWAKPGTYSLVHRHLSRAWKVSLGLPLAFMQVAL